MRIVGDSIFQLKRFQKEAYGSKTFTVNIAFCSLYIPHDYLILAPGAHFLAYTLLKEYRFEEAADNFNKALKLYNSYYRTPAIRENARECENCIKICKEGQEKVDEYLKECELKSLQVLKIDKEKYYYNK